MARNNINMTIDTANSRVQIDFLKADDTTVSGTKYITAPWGRMEADGIGWVFDKIDEMSFNQEIFYDQIILLNGGAIDSSYAEVTALLLALQAGSSTVVEVNIAEADIEIGAVELKDATSTTRAKIVAGNSAGTTDNAVVVADPNVKSDTGSIKTAVELIDDSVYTINTGTPSKGVLGMLSDGTHPQALVGDATKGLKVQITDGSGNQITEFGGADVDDAAFTPATSKGTVMMGIVTTDSVDSGDKGALAMTATRELKIATNAVTAHGDADANNPTKIGGKASATIATAVDEGDRVNANFTLNGEQRVMTEPHSYIQATHMSPVDGTVSYTSSSTLTCSGFPFTVDISTCNIRSLMVTTVGYTSILYENGVDGILISSAANVVMVYRNGVALTPFLATDLKYGIAIAYQGKGYDATTDTAKVSVLNPTWSRMTDIDTLISASQTITGTAVDLGPEIDCWGYKTIRLYITVDINDAANVRLKVLGKHTSAGAEEYELPTKVVASTEVKVTAMYYELDVDGDQLVVLDWDVTAIPIVQFQVWAGTAGTTGAITAAYCTKAY